MLNQNRREVGDDVLDARVSSLLEAASAPCEPGPLPGEAEALAAFRAHQTSPRRSSMLTTLTSLKAGLAAALGAGVLVTGGVGMAAAGALPDGAQDTASEMLAKVGVTVPGGEAKTAAEDTESSEDDASGEERPDASDKGHEVSELARSTDLEGAEKGAAVSDLASDGRSRAGEEHGEEHGEDASERGTSTAHEKTADADDHADQAGDRADKGSDSRDDAADAGEAKAKDADDAGSEADERP